MQVRAAVSTAIIVACFATMGHAQGLRNSAAQSWSSSYGNPSAAERNVRLNAAMEQERLKRGFYDPQSTVINNNTVNHNDHSVSNNVNAAEGSVVDIQNRTADGTGDSTYAVGAVNNSTTNVKTDGNGNVISVSNSAESEGCIDGAITTSANRVVGGIDISSGGGADGVSSSSVNVSRGDC